MKTPILDVGRAAKNDDVTKVTGYLLSTRRLLSWRPTGNSPYGAKKRRHADPRQVKEGLEGICLMAAIGLAYSIYPDIVIGRMTLWEAAAATESLQFIFWGAIITLPAILGYTVYVHRVFSGKATELSYD